MALRLALLFRSLPFLCLLAFTTHRATAQTRNIALRVTQTLEEKEKKQSQKPHTHTTIYRRCHPVPTENLVLAPLRLPRGPCNTLHSLFCILLISNVLLSFGEAHGLALIVNTFKGLDLSAGFLSAMKN